MNVRYERIGLKLRMPLIEQPFSGRLIIRKKAIAHKGGSSSIPFSYYVWDKSYIDKRV